MLRFTEEHEWLKQDGDEVIVGITEYAAEQLGDLVFVELPEEGRTVAKGEEIVTIESVKAASDVSAPLDGQIIEVNPAIVANPALVNEDPMEDGWFFKMTLEDPVRARGADGRGGLPGVHRVVRDVAIEDNPRRSSEPRAPTRPARINHR